MKKEEIIMKKSKIETRDIIKISLFLALFLYIFFSITPIFRNKTNAADTYGFQFEQKDSLDIIMAGSSKMYSSIYPLLLWHNQGIRSYNLGSDSQNIPVSYYVIKYAIKQQHPSLVILDVGKCIDGRKSESDATLHKLWDNLPLSKEKIECVFDCADNPKSFFITMIEYHSRWSELSSKDFEPIEDWQKGAHFPGPDIYRDAEIFPVEIGRNETLPDNTEKYLMMIIDLCKENGVDLLLVGMPNATDNEIQQMQFNTIESIAKENNINFINLYKEYEKIGLDWDKAFVDESHINAKSGKCFTEYLGNYVVENYDINIGLYGNDISSKWDEEYDFFYERLQETIVQIEEME